MLNTAEVLTSSAAEPLHRRRDPGLAAARISTRTLWGDPRWVLDNPTPGSHTSTSSIQWDVLLPDGSNLLDAAHAPILDWMKRLAWSLAAEPADGAAPLAPGSFSILSTGLRDFARWMNRHELRSPAEFDETVWDTFLDEVAELLADDADDEADLSVGQALIRVRIPTLIWRQRHALAAAGVPSPTCAPWDGRPATDVAAEIATRAHGWIRPLPDEVALPLLNAAARMVGLPADDLIRAIANSDYAAQRPAGERRPEWDRSYQTDLRKEELAWHRFSVLDGENAPWHPPLEAFRNSKGEWITPLQRLRQLVLAVQAAAAIVIQSSTGMRVSEICGLPSGRSETGLPKAVRVEPSATGLNEVFLVRTVLSKTEQGPREVDWLVGMRPLGSEELPLPVRAMLVLEDLLAPFRDLGGSNKLLVALSNNRGLPRSAEAVGAILGSNLLRQFRNFVDEWVDLSDLPNQSAHPHDEDDLVIYRQTRGRCIRTHQFRKTYAAFVLSVDPRLLPALQFHFHHISQAMTEGAYWGRNPLQIEPLSTTQKQRTAELMYEMATGESITAGRMGDHLRDQVEQLRSQIAGRPKSEGWRAALRFVNDYDLRLWFAPHGNCLPLVPESMRCHDVAGTASWLNREPNYSAREPSVCAGCACFVVDARHTEFWKDRYIENQTAFMRAQNTEFESTFRVMRERAAQAKALLRRLNIDTGDLDREAEGRMHEES